MAAEPVFIDTNVLVYANQQNSQHHEKARSLLASAERDGAVLWISRQVLREYLASVTRVQGSEPALPTAVALERVRFFAIRFNVAEDGPNVFHELTELLAQVPTGGRQVHDANLVATMLAHGLTRLLTFNVADFRRFSSWVEIVAP